jgi:hypothetical protein
MAQTRRKRQTKHRGNAAGVVESRGRTGRKPTAAEKSGPVESSRAKSQRGKREEAPPTWRGAFVRGMGAAVMLLAALLILKITKSSQAIAFFPLAILIYTPISYYMDLYLYRRRQRKKAQARSSKAASQ